MVKQGSKNLYQHLFDLRKCLIYSFCMLILGFGVCWFLSDEIVQLISLPITPYLSEEGLIFTAPMDEFLAHIKISFFGSFVLSFPFIMYQVWRFLSPGLYKSEKKILITLSFLTTVLFLAGILFIYFIVYPLTFKFLLNFGSALPFISIKEYLGFFIETSFLFGIVFELPVVILGLVWLNIIKVDQLKKGRRYAVIILALLAALVTPPDVLSMIILLGPLYLLYELAILLSHLHQRK